MRAARGRRAPRRGRRLRTSQDEKTTHGHHGRPAIFAQTTEPCSQSRFSGAVAMRLRQPASRG